MLRRASHSLYEPLVSKRKKERHDHRLVPLATLRSSSLHPTTQNQKLAPAHAPRQLGKLNKCAPMRCEFPTPCTCCRDCSSKRYRRKLEFCVNLERCLASCTENQSLRMAARPEPAVQVAKVGLTQPAWAAKAPRTLTTTTLQDANRAIVCVVALQRGEEHALSCITCARSP